MSQSILSAQSYYADNKHRISLATSETKFARYLAVPCPSIPSIAAAPATAFARMIAALIPPGTIPAATRPAVPPSLESVLDVLQRVEIVDCCAHCMGWTSYGRFRNSAHQHSACRERCCRSDCKNQFTHCLLLWWFILGVRSTARPAVAYFRIPRCEAVTPAARGREKTGADTAQNVRDVTSCVMLLELEPI